VAGDFFHKAKPPLKLIKWVVDKLIDFDVVPIIIPGQHDLPYHSIEYLNESGIGLLAAIGLVDVVTSWDGPYKIGKTVIIGHHFGDSPDSSEHFCETYKNDFDRDDVLMLVWHHLVIKKGEELWPGQKAVVAGKLLREHPEFKFIITGDNHRTFIESFYKHRKLINCGSMMRMTIDQKDHTPSVFGIVDNEHIVEYKLPIESDVFDLDFGVKHVQLDERIHSFISHLMADYEVSISYEKNLEQLFSTKKISPAVKEIIRGCLSE